MNRIKRAKAQDKVMTVIFYCIAVFFFVLLAAFAGYVIIKGFAGAKPSMFGFTRRGAIGNQLFNTIYLVFLSLLITVEDTADVRAARNSKTGFVKMVLNFCVSQGLLMEAQSRYYPTDRFKALIENYFDEYKGRMAEIMQSLI